MVPARIEMDDACAILDPFLLMCVDVLLDYQDESELPQHRCHPPLYEPPLFLLVAI